LDLERHIEQVVPTVPGVISLRSIHPLASISPVVSSWSGVYLVIRVIWPENFWPFALVSVAVPVSTPVRPTLPGSGWLRLIVHDMPLMLNDPVSEYGVSVGSMSVDVPVQVPVRFLYGTDVGTLLIVSVPEHVVVTKWVGFMLRVTQAGRLGTGEVCRYRWPTAHCRSCRFGDIRVIGSRRGPSRFVISRPGI
jgi:hypothetical protein